MLHTLLESSRRARRRVTNPLLPLELGDAAGCEAVCRALVAALLTLEGQGLWEAPPSLLNEAACLHPPIAEAYLAQLLGHTGGVGGAGSVERGDRLRAFRDHSPKLRDLYDEHPRSQKTSLSSNGAEVRARPATCNQQL
jgi:hypothetical protein